MPYLAFSVVKVASYFVGHAQPQFDSLQLWNDECSTKVLRTKLSEPKTTLIAEMQLLETA